MNTSMKNQEPLELTSPNIRLSIGPNDLFQPKVTQKSSNSNLQYSEVINEFIEQYYLKRQQQILLFSAFLCLVKALVIMVNSSTCNLSANSGCSSPLLIGLCISGLGVLILVQLAVFFRFTKKPQKKKKPFQHCFIDILAGVVAFMFSVILSEYYLDWQVNVEQQHVGKPLFSYNKQDVSSFGAQSFWVGAWLAVTQILFAKICRFYAVRMLIHVFSFGYFMLRYSMDLHSVTSVIVENAVLVVGLLVYMRKGFQLDTMNLQENFNNIQEKENIRQLFDIIPEGLALIDENFQIDFCNRTLLRMMGSEHPHIAFVELTNLSNNINLTAIKNFSELEEKIIQQKQIQQQMQINNTDNSQQQPQITAIQVEQQQKQNSEQEQQQFQSQQDQLEQVPEENNNLILNNKNSNTKANDINKIKIRNDQRQNSEVLQNLEFKPLQHQEKQSEQQQQKINLDLLKEIKNYQKTDQFVTSQQDIPLVSKKFLPNQLPQTVQSSQQQQQEKMQPQQQQQVQQQQQLLQNKPQQIETSISKVLFNKQILEQENQVNSSFHIQKEKPCEHDEIQPQQQQHKSMQLITIMENSKQEEIKESNHSKKIQFHESTFIPFNQKKPKKSSLSYNNFKNISNNNIKNNNNNNYNNQGQGNGNNNINNQNEQQLNNQNQQQQRSDHNLYLKTPQLRNEQQQQQQIPVSLRQLPEAQNAIFSCLHSDHTLINPNKEKQLEVKFQQQPDILNDEMGQNMQQSPQCNPKSGGSGGGGVLSNFFNSNDKKSKKSSSNEVQQQQQIQVQQSKYSQHQQEVVDMHQVKLRTKSFSRKMQLFMSTFKTVGKSIEALLQAFRENYSSSNKSFSVKDFMMDQQQQQQLQQGENINDASQRGTQILYSQQQQQQPQQQLQQQLLQKQSSQQQNQQNPQSSIINNSGVAGGLGAAYISNAIIDNANNSNCKTIFNANNCIILNSEHKVGEELFHFEIKLIPSIQHKKPQIIVLVRDTTESLELIKLKELDKHKQQILHEVSHELRTPLTAIISLQEELSKQLTQEQLDKYLRPSLSSSKVLLSITNDYLDFAQMREGKLKIINQQVDLQKLCQEIIDTLGITSKQKGIKLILIYDPMIPKKVETDPNRLRQIILNLIGNAIKFTKKNGDIYLGLVNQYSDIQIYVQDTGIGIKEKDQRKLFQAFTRLETDEMAEMNPQGVGLGLMISYSLAKRLNPEGQGLLLKSSIGQGSKFYFTIKGGSSNSRYRTGGGSGDTGLGAIAQEGGQRKNDLQKIPEINDNESAIINMMNSTDEGLNVHLNVLNHTVGKCKFIQDKKEVDENNNNNTTYQYQQQLQQNQMQISKSFDNAFQNDYQIQKVFQEPFLPSNKPEIRQQQLQFSSIIQQQPLYQLNQQQPSQGQQQQIIINNRNTPILQPEGESISLVQRSCDKSTQPNEKKPATLNTCATQNSVSLHYKLDTSHSLIKKKNCSCPEILCIDDEVFNIKAYEVMLNSLNFQPELAYSGFEAIEIVNDRINQNKCCPNFQIIFIDIQMNDMDGFETRKKIAKIYAKNNLKTVLVACTGNTSEEDQQECLQAGFNLFLPKPFNSEQLLSILKQFNQFYF